MLNFNPLNPKIKLEQYEPQKQERYVCARNIKGIYNTLYNILCKYISFKLIYEDVRLF